MAEVDLREITEQWDYGTLPPDVLLGQRCFLERKGSFELGRVIGDVRREAG